MRHRINAGVGSGARGHTGGQAVINDGGNRHKTQAHTQQFFIVGFIGDDGEFGHFRACACGGRYRHNRHTAFMHLAREFVIADFAAKLAQNRNGFGRINRAAATQGDDDIVVTVLYPRHTCGDGAVGRFRHGVIKHISVDAHRGKQGLNFVHIAQLHHHLIGDD